MVKQGSFFTRLAERWRAGSGVKVEAGHTAGADVARPPLNRVDPAAAAGELRSTRKLSEREEAMVVLGTHFQELAGLMRGVQTRMDSQVGRLADAADSLRQLPGIGTQQLDLLRGLAAHMEKQNSLGEQMTRTLAVLPQLLSNVEGALQRAATTDERTSATMREFQGTMDRIHTSMAAMVDHSQQQVEATKSFAQQREESLRSIASNLEQTQRDSVKELRSAADDSLKSLRVSHEDQSSRLRRVVQEQAGWNKAVLAGLGVVTIGLVALLIIQLVK
jgi:plasmid stabilization system protein ParE